jgi:hypothetical protein
MRERTSRRTHLLLAVAAALVYMTVVTLPAAAGDANVGGTLALEDGRANLDVSGDGQFNEDMVGLDRRMRLYLEATTAEAFDVSLTGASTPLTFQGGRNLWTPLVALTPIQGLFLGVGAGWTSAMVVAQDLAPNQYGLGLEGVYQGDTATFYVEGLTNFNRMGSPVRSSGDFTAYQISAGGTMTGSPVAVGVDLFYFGRTERERFGEAGFAATPGAVGDMTLFAEEVVFSGFFDGESAIYRRTTGAAKASAIGVGSTGQANTPAHIRALGGHLDFRPMRETVFQLGGAYLQFVEDVTSAGGSGADESLGTSMYLRLTHGITDGLQLRAAFDYLYSSDGSRETKGDEDAYKVAAGLFWSW